MPQSTAPRSFGRVTRTFHWLTALLILTAIPLGIIANDMAYDSAAALAQKAQLFSLHKTLGVAAFAVAALRILWALTQTHPAPLHPSRRVETALAAVIHWVLYISMLAVPLSGWVHHAATSGFAPILWPAALGQDLPFVPKSETLAHLAASAHWVFTKLLIASILLHIAGALKHHLIDKDATLRRMMFGTAAATPDTPQTSRLPMLAAIAIYAIGAGVAILINPETTAPTTAAIQTTQTKGNWQVETGTLGITVQQLGTAVSGSFATWAADITFDPTATTEMGTVTVTIDLNSLALGSVSDQAKGPDFLNTATHSTAQFTAQINQAANDSYTATGSLALAGVTLPLTLPFTLQINGDTAQMQATTTLDRRDFAIGPKYPDESSVGFTVTITVALTATQSSKP